MHACTPWMASLLTASLLMGCEGSLQELTVERENRQYQPISLMYYTPIRDIAAEPLLVAAVETSNAANKYLSSQDIMARDQTWRAGDPEQTLVPTVLENETADYLRHMQTIFPAFVEMFVMDNRGCLVASSKLTTDYWQGDEPKWYKIFVEDYGEYYVDEISFDESVGRYVHHYSMPVLGKNRKLLGGIVVGVLPEDE